MSGESMTSLLPAVIKVAIVEDNSKYRDMLAFFIGSTDGYHCVGGDHSIEEALVKIGFDLPDLGLGGVGLPGMSGIRGLRLLKERYPTRLLLTLTSLRD